MDIVPASGSDHYYISSSSGLELWLITLVGRLLYCTVRGLL